MLVLSYSQIRYRYPVFCCRNHMDAVEDVSLVLQPSGAETGRSVQWRRGPVRRSPAWASQNTACRAVAPGRMPAGATARLGQVGATARTEEGGKRAGEQSVVTA